MAAVDTLPAPPALDKGWPMAHVPSFEGSLRGLCGRRLKGRPAPAGVERCIVCASLAGETLTERREPNG